MNLSDILKVHNKTELSTPQEVQVWKSWYNGYDQSFHAYRYWNGTSNIDMKRKSLGMAKQVCESWASLLMNERVEFYVKGLEDWIVENNVRLKANEGIEKTWALGQGAFVINVENLEIGQRTGLLNKDKASVTFNFIDREKAHILTVDNYKVKECAFVSEYNDRIVYVVHILQNNRYVIYNYITNAEGKLIDKWKFDTKSNIPFFQFIRPNIVDNYKLVNKGTELGISIFANAIHVLKTIDTIYDTFDWEFVAGKKRLLVPSDGAQFRKDTNGNREPFFDPNNDMYYFIAPGQDGKTVMPEDKSGELRVEQLKSGLNGSLDTLSMKCGLGETYYKFDGVNPMTATQVVSENSSLYRNIKKHEILIEDALVNILYATVYAHNEFTTTNLGDIKKKDIKISFDDSIIEDKGAELERDKSLVASGLMSRVEFRMRWMNEKEEDARKNVLKFFRAEELGRYATLLQQGAITPEDFVNECYSDKDEDEQAAIAIYIYENADKSPFSDMNDLYEGDET